MVKKVSKSAQLKSKLSKAIIDTIVAMGGSASRKDIIAAIENSQIFDAWESEVLRSNKRRWVTALDLQSNELVNSGQIIKQNGVWIVPENGLTIESPLFSMRFETSSEKNFDLPSPLRFTPKDMDELFGEGKRYLEEDPLDDFVSDYKTFDDLMEPPWMQIIRGKINPHPNDSAGKEAKMLRNSFLTYERKKSIESIDTSKRFVEFREKLAAIGNAENVLSETKKELSWWALIKLMIALVSGLVIGMMVPMQLATRGAHDSSTLGNFGPANHSEKFSIRVTLRDKSPLTLAKDIIFTAVDSKVEVKVLNNGGLHLVIYGLKPLDESQISLKATLGLGGEAEGNAEVVILKSE